MKTRVNSALKVMNWVLLKVYQNYQMQYPTPLSIQIQNNHNNFTKFLIENEHCRPKGPFLKDSDNRSFLEKYFYIVSKSGVKLERGYPIL